MANLNDVRTYGRTTKAVPRTALASYAKPAVKNICFSKENLSYNKTGPVELVGQGGDRPPVF